MNPGNNMNQNNQPQSQAPVVSPDAIMNALQGRPNTNQPNMGMGGQMNPNVPPMQQMNPNMPPQQPMQPVAIPPQQPSQTPPTGKKKIEPKTIFLVIAMVAVILICTGIMILLGKEEEPPAPQPAPSPTQQEVSYTEKLNEISSIFNELDSVKAFKESKNATVTSSVTGNTLKITITGDEETTYEANVEKSILTLTSPTTSSSTSTTNNENSISPKEIFDCIVRAKGILDGLELEQINAVLESEEANVLTLENNGVSYNDDGTTYTYSLNINSSLSLPEVEVTPNPSSNPNAETPNPTASPEPTASPNPTASPEPSPSPSPSPTASPEVSPSPSPATNQ